MKHIQAANPPDLFGIRFDAIIRIPSTDSRNIYFTYSENNKRVSAFVLDQTLNRVDVHPQGLPKELKKITHVKAFRNFFKDVYVKIRPSNDGSISLSIHHRLRGGMENSNLEEIKQNQEVNERILLLEENLNTFEHQNEENKIHTIREVSKVLENTRFNFKPQPYTLFLGGSRTDTNTLANYLSGAEIRIVWDDLANEFHLTAGEGKDESKSRFFTCSRASHSEGVITEIIRAKQTQSLIDVATTVKLVIPVNEDYITERVQLELFKDAINALESLGSDFNQIKEGVLFVITNGKRVPSRNENDFIIRKLDEILKDQSLSPYQKQCIGFIKERKRFLYAFKAPDDEAIEGGLVSTQEREKIISAIETELEPLKIQSEIALKVTNESKIKIERLLKLIQDCFEKKIHFVVNDIQNYLEQAFEALNHSECIFQDELEMCISRLNLTQLSNAVDASLTKEFSEIKECFHHFHKVLPEELREKLKEEFFRVEDLEGALLSYGRALADILNLNRTAQNSCLEACIANTWKSCFLQLHRKIKDLRRKFKALEEHTLISPLQVSNNSSIDEDKFNLYIGQAKSFTEICSSFENAEKSYEQALTWTNNVVHYENYGILLCKQGNAIKANKIIQGLRHYYESTGKLHDAAKIFFQAIFIAFDSGKEDLLEKLIISGQLNKTFIDIQLLFLHENSIKGNKKKLCFLIRPFFKYKANFLLSNVCLERLISLKEPLGDQALLQLFSQLQRDFLKSLERENVNKLFPTLCSYGRFLLEEKFYQEFKIYFSDLAQTSALEPIRYPLHAIAQKDHPSYPLIQEIASIPNSETGFRYSFLEKFSLLEKGIMHMTSAVLPVSAEAKCRLHTILWKGEVLPCAMNNSKQNLSEITGFLKPEFFHALLKENIVDQTKTLDREAAFRLLVKEGFKTGSFFFEEDRLNFQLDTELKILKKSAIERLHQRIFGCRFSTVSTLAKITLEFGNRSYHFPITISIDNHPDLHDHLFQKTEDWWEQIQPGKFISAWLEELQAIRRGWNALYEEDMFKSTLSSEWLSLRGISTLYLQLLEFQELNRDFSKKTPSAFERVARCMKANNQIKKIETHICNLFTLSCHPESLQSDSAQETLPTFREMQTQYLQAFQNPGISNSEGKRNLPLKLEELNNSDFLISEEMALSQLQRLRGFYEDEGVSKFSLFSDSEKDCFFHLAERPLLDFLLSKTGIIHLTLPGVSCLSDSVLEKMIQLNGYSLKSISLQGCRNISLEPLLKNINFLTKLEKLYLSDQKLSDFILNGGKWFSQAEPVPLPNLEELSIIDCVGIKSLYIDAPKLRILTINANIELNLNGKGMLVPKKAEKVIKLEKIESRWVLQSSFS